MIYLLDSNAFMEAARLYYGFDMVPAFWSWLKGKPLSGRVGSIQAVKDEIMNGEGDLVDWARAMPSEFWLSDSSASIANMARLAAWVSESERPYEQPAVSEFMSSADMRLIALAMETGGTVATREAPAPRSKKKIKIPDVCAAFGVACVTPFDSYRSLGMRLV